MEEDLFDILEPLPDIHALYMLYNGLYFENSLGACSVHWSSSRMTLCAGVCEFSKGGGCKIKLSEPLLKFRPTRDLKETLLHEMVHAWIFLMGIRDGDHGPRFQEKVKAINAATFPDPQRPPGGYRVSTYHNFITEVDHFRTHHWKCERCDNLVKRAMNRPPQPADCRGRSGVGEACRDVKCAFHMHQRFCGGNYIKVAEPENYGQKGKKSREAGGGSAARRNKPPRETGTYSITNFFGRVHESPTTTDVPGPSCPLPASAAAAAVSGKRQEPGRDTSRDRPGDQQTGAGVEGGAPSSGVAGPHLGTDARSGAKIGFKRQGSETLTQSKGSTEMAGLDAAADVNEVPVGGGHASVNGLWDNKEGQPSKRVKQDPAGDRESYEVHGERAPGKDAMRRLLAEAAMRRMGVFSEPAGAKAGAARGIFDQSPSGPPGRGCNAGPLVGGSLQASSELRDPTSVSSFQAGPSSRAEQCRGSSSQPGLKAPAEKVGKISDVMGFFRRCERMEGDSLRAEHGDLDRRREGGGSERSSGSVQAPSARYEFATVVDASLAREGLENVRTAGPDGSKAGGATVVGDGESRVYTERGRGLRLGGNAAPAETEGPRGASRLREDRSGGEHRDGGAETSGTRKEGVGGHQGGSSWVIGGATGGSAVLETRVVENKHASKSRLRASVDVTQGSTDNSVIDLVSSDDEM